MRMRVTLLHTLERLDVDVYIVYAQHWKILKKNKERMVKLVENKMKEREQKRGRMWEKEQGKKQANVKVRVGTSTSFLSRWVRHPTPRSKAPVLSDHKRPSQPSFGVTHSSIQFGRIVPYQHPPLRRLKGCNPIWHRINFNRLVSNHLFDKMNSNKLINRPQFRGQSGFQINTNS